MNTVKLKNYLNVVEEYVAGGTITPGHLVKLNSSDKVVVSDVDGSTAIPMFATEDEFQGNGITDDYTSDDKVQVWIPQRGDQVYAFLKNGENVDIGDYLVVSDNGTLKEYVPQTVTGDSGFDDDTSLPDNKVVAQAIEAVNASGGDSRIKVRIV